MATLDEMKKKFQRSEPQEEAPKKRKRVKLIDRMRDKGSDEAPDQKPAKQAFTKPGGAFRPATDNEGGPDAILGFSRDYKGRRVSEMAAEGDKTAGFLFWVLRKHAEEIAEGGPGFRKELVRIIKFQLGKK